jgi:hypothetical protein
MGSCLPWRECWRRSGGALDAKWSVSLVRLAVEFVDLPRKSRFI